MTNEEAKAFLDNLKICINEHPVVADWLVEIADRKTEPTHDLRTETHECVKTTKKPCSVCKYYDWEWDEHIGYREICYNIGNCQFKAKTEPQYDAEEVAKDINRRVDMVKKEWNARHIEDEPQTDCSWR